MSINIVTFSGNLAAEPRKAGSEDNPILSFTLAVNTSRKVNGEWVDEPFYIDCNTFGQRAKKLADILCKGMPVTVQGSMVPNNYTDKDGNKKFGYRVNCQEIVLPPKPESEKPDSKKSW